VGVGCGGPAVDTEAVDRVVSDEREQPRAERIGALLVTRERFEDFQEDMLAGVFCVGVVFEGREEIAIDVWEVVVVERRGGSFVSCFGSTDELIVIGGGGFDRATGCLVEGAGWHPRATA
jgi:hypothetical protein